MKAELDQEVHLAFERLQAAANAVVDEGWRLCT